MTNKLIPRKFTRRDFLKLGARGALLTALGGSALATMARFNPSEAAPAPPLAALDSPPARPNAANPLIRLGATDGFISLPGRRLADDNGLYVFGFSAAPLGVSAINDFIGALKGNIQLPAPILVFDEGDEVKVTLTNLGFVGRPDLDDSHTIHWHGFRNPNAVYDGVPEASISVPVARDFVYFYRPEDEGTYMYHCHFEDTEHVQMGMDGIVFVRPSQYGTSLGGFTKFAYNDGDGSTGYDREFTLLLNEVDTHPHDGLIAVQEFVWSDYKANYWMINGRAYPDTIIRDQDLPGSVFDRGPAVHPDFRFSQPVSSLIQVNEGETALLRFVNLGYEQQAMQLPGIRMTVVGEDATLLRGPGGANLYYDTNTIYIGPGEARDVLFEAPAYVGPGPYDIYWLKNRNYHRLVNGTESGLGGQVTQVWVYPVDSLDPQTGPNKTL